MSEVPLTMQWVASQGVSTIVWQGNPIVVDFGRYFFNITWWTDPIPPLRSLGIHIESLDLPVVSVGSVAWSSSVYGGSWEFGSSFAPATGEFQIDLSSDIDPVIWPEGTPASHLSNMPVLASEVFNAPLTGVDYLGAGNHFGDYFDAAFTSLLEQKTRQVGYAQGQRAQLRLRLNTVSQDLLLGMLPNFDTPNYPTAGGLAGNFSVVLTPVAGVPYVDCVLTVAAPGTTFSHATQSARPMSHVVLESLLLPETPTTGSDSDYFILIDMGPRGLHLIPSTTYDSGAEEITVARGSGPTLDTGTIGLGSKAGEWSVTTHFTVTSGSRIYIGYQGGVLLVTQQVEADSEDEASNLSVTAAGNDLTKTVLIEYDDTKGEAEIVSALEKCSMAVIKKLSST